MFIVKSFFGNVDKSTPPAAKPDATTQSPREDAHTSLSSVAPLGLESQQMVKATGKDFMVHIM